MVGSPVEDAEARRPPPRKPWRRIRLVVVTVVGVVALAVVAMGMSYVFRSSPGPKSVESAVERFRASSTTSSPAPEVLIRPDPGVYRARGEGETTISKPPNAQQDGATMPISVEYLPEGCWRWRIDYNTSRWHEMDFCPEGPALYLTAQRNAQEWDFGFSKVTNRAEYRCSPPAPVVVATPEVGERFTHDCEGTNSAVEGLSISKGPAEIVGIDVITIGGEKVAAVHQTRDQAMSGSQAGTVHEDTWFARDTGLPLKSTRRYRLKTDSPVGSIDYAEDGSWTLASITPAT